MHAVRQELLRAGRSRRAATHRSADSLSVQQCRLRKPHARVDRAPAGERVERMAFGDLYLDDIRAYREKQLQGTGIAPVFPLWNEPTAALARTMIAGGLRAVLTCVDPKRLAPEFCGRHSMPRCSMRCPRAWIRAAKTANSTASPAPGRCSAHRSRWRPAKPSNATGLCSPTCAWSAERPVFAALQRKSSARRAGHPDTSGSERNIS